MGDALGTIGQGLMAVPRAGMDTLGGVGTYFGGEGKDLPWNDQIGRVLVGILSGGDPYKLAKLHALWSQQDQAGMQDPAYAAALAGPGGEDAIRKMHLPLPPKAPIELAQGGPTQSLVAVPSKPGNPTTEAYRLPQTPLQMQLQTFNQAKGAVGTDPRFAASVGVGESGIPTFKGTERDLSKGIVVTAAQLSDPTFLVAGLPALTAIATKMVDVQTIRDASGQDTYFLTPNTETQAEQKGRGTAVGQAGVSEGDLVVPGGTKRRDLANAALVDQLKNRNAVSPGILGLLGGAPSTTAGLPPPLAGAQPPTTGRTPSVGDLNALAASQPPAITTGAQEATGLLPGGEKGAAADEERATKAAGLAIEGQSQAERVHGATQSLRQLAGSAGLRASQFPPTLGGVIGSALYGIKQEALTSKIGSRIAGNENLAAFEAAGKTSLLPILRNIGDKGFRAAQLLNESAAGLRVGADDTLPRALLKLATIDKLADALNGVSPLANPTDPVQRVTPQQDQTYTAAHEAVMAEYAKASSLLAEIEKRPAALAEFQRRLQGLSP